MIGPAWFMAGPRQPQPQPDDEPQGMRERKLGARQRAVIESSIVVDLTHPGFSAADASNEDIEHWFDELLGIAKSHGNQDAVRDFDGWTQGWEDQFPSEAYYAEFPEHQAAQTIAS